MTALLDAWSAGSSGALDQLLPLVMDDLRDLARRYMARENPGHTLEPTDLVSEAYIKLVGRREVHLESRAQLSSVLALTMRRSLVDHARRKRAARHGGGHPVEPLDQVRGVPVPVDVDLLALDDALHELATLDRRRHDVVQLSYFGGLTLEEIATVLDISVITVRRDLKTAKIWLLHALRVRDTGTH
ncbi:MAG: ECF-type sigma factor [Acidobacteriota bacterium]